MDFGLKEMGGRLRASREAKRLTQPQVAEYLSLQNEDMTEVSKQTVSHWERGDNWTPYPYLTGLAILYGRSLNWLIVGVEAEEMLMGEEEYEFARLAADAPPPLKQFLLLTAQMAEKSKDSFPASVASSPTEDTWMEFAKALYATYKR